MLPTAHALGKAQLAELGVDTARVPELGRYFALNPEWGHLTEVSPICTWRNTSMLRTQWARVWDRDRRVLVEKSPPDLIRMRMLAAAFRPSSFVVILRHPLSVCRRVPHVLQVSPESHAIISVFFLF